MKDIQQKILAFPELPEAEQAAVLAHVRRHPEFQPLLDEARALHALLAELRPADGGPVSEEALAFYVASAPYAHRPVPPVMTAEFARIEQAVGASPALAERVRALRERLALARQTDETAHFERLSGHRLGAAGSPGPPDAGAQGFRPLARAPRPLAVRRWAAAAAVGLSALYGVLYFGGQALQPPLERLALREGAEVRWAASRLRGLPAEPDGAGPAADFNRALAQLESARTSIAGLFPRYDPGALAGAAGRFERVIAAEPPGSLLALDAAYFLGLVRLAQGDAGRAREAFAAVVAGGGTRSADAARLLRAVEK